jgi:hypothetical protein
MCKNVMIFFLSFSSFSSTKSGKRRTEQVLHREQRVWYQWEGEVGGEREQEDEHGAKNVYIYMCKNDIC